MPAKGHKIFGPEFQRFLNELKSKIQQRGISCAKTCLAMLYRDLVGVMPKVRKISEWTATK